MTDLTNDVWIRICGSDELAPGERREISLPNGQLVLLMRTEKRLIACPADCPHQDTPLLDAPIDGDTLTCPAHFWQWDLATGDPLGIAEMRLHIYPVREDENCISIYAAS
ncbi:Rieske 2Fe-2S domain-containing protein [Acidiphilium sp. AL]|uniref:Rieske 2Fe-2S domain-containing protein n=1 Tax=Acidiphilium sp. AL TaxID=2871704 RepID=UPI0021CB28AB|nr:Rieske 2Fe-2S domain-containing protein [Acidiphilium sp. AL]MCU4160518.1 Rieske 2Fe-2S domain-containing protein [Acidiphilium sp. AL]